MPHRGLITEPPKGGFIEPCYVPDIFAHRLAFTEEVGPDLFRFVFAVEQKCLFTGNLEHVICCKLIVPRDMAIGNSRVAAKGIGMKAQDFMAR